MKRLFPLHIHISALFLLLVLLVGGLVGGVGYKLSRNMLEASVSALTERIDREIASELQHAVAPGEMAANVLVYSGIADDKTFAERSRRLALMRETLRRSAALASIYVGYESGDFFYLLRIRDEKDRQLAGAPERTGYVLQSIEREAGTLKHPTHPARGRFTYLGEDLKVLRDDERPDYARSYDPRTRDWYRNALAGSAQIMSSPYVFFTSQKVGITISARAENRRAVVGADIRLETLSESLKTQKVTAGSQVALADARGQVIAHEDLSARLGAAGAPDGALALPHLDDLAIPVLAKLAEMVVSPRGETTISASQYYRSKLALADGDWRAAIRPLAIEGAQPLYLLTAIPERELLAAALELRSISLIVTVLIVLCAIPVTWAIARTLSGTLRKLAGEAEAIRRFEFARPIDVRSNIREVDELTTTMDGMKTAIRRFLDISQSVAAEENFDRLLPMLLGETLSAAGAEAGVLYLADKEQLVPACALNGGGRDLIGVLRAVPVAGTDTLVGDAVRDGAPCFRQLSRADLEQGGLGALFDAGVSAHGVAVPLLNRRRELVGAILLLRRAPFEAGQVSFVRALSGSAASSLETRELIKAQKELFAAFIQLIAGAIDAKSPYTGGHCARVPELTKMLARAACAESSGPFKDFDLDDQDWEAVHVAAWLHDCGKVTTPEHVVDKATKLETLYDRIHEVRMRFEVLKRDAEIACLKAVAAGTDEAAARAGLTGETRRLDEDFCFVAACNEGGEFMAPEDIARLKQIAARTWQRTLDDRLGISHEEKERKADDPAPALPATEFLLADKPEHLFRRRAQDCMPEDNPWGIRMAMPELLYNKGEVYNLAVGRGTLSEEERYKINEHSVQTLIMLAQLPFPKHMRQVPEIAGGHHEKMDGGGYPKRLTKDEMSPLARMMAIADIFEALTAVDRPYKKGKTLSEAIHIMSRMKKDSHIDPDLFDLFMRSGVYREYARRFMKPEQIDEVHETGETDRERPIGGAMT